MYTLRIPKTALMFMGPNRSGLRTAMAAAIADVTKRGGRVLIFGINPDQEIFRSYMANAGAITGMVRQLSWQARDQECRGFHIESYDTICFIGQHSFVTEGVFLTERPPSEGTAYVLDRAQMFAKEKCYNPAVYIEVRSRVHESPLRLS